jgi:hypothetical protein
MARRPGAKPPQSLSRPSAGEVMPIESSGASNAKAKRELGWTLRHPRWRQGVLEASR